MFWTRTKVPYLTLVRYLKYLTCTLSEVLAVRTTLLYLTLPSSIRCLMFSNVGGGIPKQYHCLRKACHSHSQLTASIAQAHHLPVRQHFHFLTSHTIFLASGLSSLLRPRERLFISFLQYLLSSACLKAS